VADQNAGAGQSVEFFRLAFRGKFYEAVQTLQQDLNTWLYHYNNERPRQGYRNMGRRPIETIKEYVATIGEETWLYTYMNHGRRLNSKLRPCRPPNGSSTFSRKLNQIQSKNTPSVGSKEGLGCVDFINLQFTSHRHNDFALCVSCFGILMGLGNFTQ
jgi:hypothetical protein